MALVDADGSSKDTETADFLARQCLQFQKRRAYVIGPAMLVIALWGYWATRAWQVGVIVGVMVLTAVMFFVGLYFATQKRVELSLWAAVVPTLITCASVITLLDGFDVALTLTAVSLVVQVSVFSRRISLFGVIGILLIVLAAQAFDTGLLFLRLRITPWVALVASSVVASIMIAQFWVYLRKHYQNAQLFIKRQQEFLRRREQILNAVSETIPSVERSVGDTTGISSDMADRVLLQANAIETITTLLSSLTLGASTTTATAQKSYRISEGIKGLIRDNYNRLQDVAKSSENVVRNMHDARKIIGALVAQMDNVEKILSYNRSIGEQIKVLSVNASIEAAEAGNYGAGFAVVARELTEMIDSTEKNLFETAALLNDIRRQSNLGMTSIDATTAMLERFFEELTRTRDTLEKAVASSNAAARQTEQIVMGAETQQGELARVGEGTQTLLDNAFELAVSSALLQDTVTQLNHLRASLAEMIAQKGDDGMTYKA
ncbi:MAG: methyl-accepting chemotaxis protein [Deltaproteobacteria bacterium]|nr:methyl-accepting chemotaxis protein [Deltaproteobacteria bacterium]